MTPATAAAKTLQLTPRGRALARRALQAAAELDAELLADLDVEQVDGLRAALRQVTAIHGLGVRHGHSTGPDQQPR